MDEFDWYEWQPKLSTLADLEDRWWISTHRKRETGGGIAVSMVLGVVVCASQVKDTVSVFTLPKLATPDHAAMKPRLLFELGGHGPEVNPPCSLRSCIVAPRDLWHLHRPQRHTRLCFW